MSRPENVLSIVKMFGQVLSSLYILTLAVDSFDFYTPNLQDPKWKNLLSFESIRGKTLHSSGFRVLLQPYIKTFYFLE
jgi:hypothetical protein